MQGVGSLSNLQNIPSQDVPDEVNKSFMYLYNKQQSNLNTISQD